MLPDDVHFLQQIASSAKLVHQEQNVADVHTDATLQVRLEHDVAGHALPVAVEGKADQLTVRIEDRTAGIASGDVIVGEEAARQVAVRHRILAVILRLIEFLQLGRDLELVVVRILFLDHAVDSGIMPVKESVLR